MHLAWLLLLAAMTGCIGSTDVTGREDDFERRGALEVSVVTTGANPDPDGYDLTIHEGASESVDVNGSVTFTGLSPGVHQVTLMGEAANCTVGPSNPQSATVASGETSPVSFLVHCP